MPHKCSIYNDYSLKYAFDVKINYFHCHCHCYSKNSYIVNFILLSIFGYEMKFLEIIGNI